VIRGFDTSKLAALSAARTVDCISLTQMVIEGCHCSSNVVRQCSAFREQLRSQQFTVLVPVEFVVPSSNYSVNFLKFHFRLAQFVAPGSQC
jgi:hypothetical protein